MAVSRYITDEINQEFALAHKCALLCVNIFVLHCRCVLHPLPDQPRQQVLRVPPMLEARRRDAAITLPTVHPAPAGLFEWCVFARLAGLGTRAAGCSITRFESGYPM